jgi:ribonuclease T2
MSMIKNSLNGLLAILVSCSLLLWSNPAQATVSVSGELVAQQSCEAVQSIKKGTNPGNITLNSGQTYSP